MQSQLTIVGIKQFKGDVEGQHFDHTKLIVLLPFPKARSASNLGFDALEAPYGDSNNYKQFDGLKFPQVLDCEYEVTTKGIEIFDVSFPSARPAPSTPNKA